MRIEDDVLITPDGPEMLTSVPRDWESLLAMTNQLSVIRHFARSQQRGRHQAIGVAGAV